MRDGEGRRARSRYGSSDPLLQRTRFDLYTIHAYIYIYTTRLHSTWYYLLNIIQYKAILTASTACLAAEDSRSGGPRKSFLFLFIFMPENVHLFIYSLTKSL